MSGDGGDQSDRNVETWKIRKLIKSLEAARGNGTSMISLIIPPKDQVFVVLIHGELENDWFLYPNELQCLWMDHGRL